jgi:hypothetical protein
LKEFIVKINGRQYVSYADSQSELEEVLSDSYADFEYTIEEIKNEQSN